MSHPRSIPDLRSQIPDLRSQIPHPKSQISDPRSQIPDFKSHFQKHKVAGAQAVVEIPPQLPLRLPYVFGIHCFPHCFPHCFLSGLAIRSASPIFGIRDCDFGAEQIGNPRLPPIFCISKEREKKCFFCISKEKEKTIFLY